MFERVTLEPINNSANFYLNGFNYSFKSYVTFKELTGYPFDNTHVVAYEPDRNIYVVERSGPEIVSGTDLEEIQWITNNIDNIVEAAHREGYGQEPELTIRDIRNIKMYETDWMVLRHRDEIDNELSTTLNNDQYKKLLDYRQKLRDITKIYVNLDEVVWPLLDL